MKVKSLAILAALFAGTAALTASGDPAATASNTFGVYKVTCDAAKVIVCTPWVKCGTTSGESVNVTDLVMTDNLSNGDAIIVYDNGAFKGWQLSGGAWTPFTVSSADDYGAAISSGDAAAAVLARGQAFWFVKSDFSTAYDLYLYGQDTAASATSTVAANAYNLLANPGTADVNINSLTWDFTPNANDTIQVPGTSATTPPTTFTYSAGNWGTTVATPVAGKYDRHGNVLTSMVWTAGCTIPAGRGFWYISKGGSGNFTW